MSDTDRDAGPPGSSTFEAAVNLAKLCIGSGVLALPYASWKGGLLFSPIGIAVIAFWNYIACSQMIRCKRACSKYTLWPGRGLSSTYSLIAYAGIGWPGVYTIDISIIITLLGVCISYQIAFASLVSDIPFIHLSRTTLSILSGLHVFPVSCAKDVGILSSYSLAGLVCLLMGIFVIICYGIWQFGAETIGNTGAVALSDSSAVSPLTYFPASLDDMTIYFGVTVFCFGLCSLTFPVEESMRNKKEIEKAVSWCLLFVLSVYTIVGDGVAILYSRHPDGISSNILQNLPEKATAATMVRFSMAAVCLLTYPLTLVPPAQMIEQLLIQNLSTCGTSGKYAYNTLRGGGGGGGGSGNIAGVEKHQSINDSNIEDFDVASYEPSTFLRCMVRASLIALCTFIATSTPCFGSVISLLGCFTVSILSFVMPAILHLRLVTIPAQQRDLLQRNDVEGDLNVGDELVPRLFLNISPPHTQYKIDMFLIVLGTITCFWGTVISFVRFQQSRAETGTC